MDTTTQNKRIKPRFDKILLTVLLIFIPTSIMHVFVEYEVGGFSVYVIRDLANVGVILSACLLYKCSVIRKSTLLTISVYSVITCVIATYIISFSDVNFRFEPFFLHAEMLMIILMFTIGMLVHFKHTLVLIILNTLLLISFICTPGNTYPIENFIYFGTMVGGGAIMAYAAQRRFIKLSRKVKDANLLIQTRNEELKAMNHSKDQLFRIIGHDLRTPFHQLSALVELLDDAKEGQEKEEIRELIKESADKGGQLLEDLLQWGNSYQDQSETILVKHPMTTIVQRVFDFCDFKSKNKDINLVNEMQDNLHMLLNSTMTETVMRNLIINAIKFSHRGGTITVRSKTELNQVQVSIIDEGIGMSPEQIKDLFTEDQNESTPGTEHEKGTGFGLNISKKLMEKQNGKFEIQSELRKGTTINLYFPLPV